MSTSRVTPGEALRKVFTVGVVLILLKGSRSVSALNDGNDLKFSEAELQALHKIKGNSALMSSLTDEYMKTDFYLIRFVRVASGDVEESQHLINETMTWRRANNISGILDEDFSDLETLFPIEYNARDKMGRPAIQVVSEYWNVREEVYYGDSDRLSRFTSYILERGMYEILKAQKEGHPNVTRILVLIDANGVGLSKHFCFSCIPFATDWIANYQTHFPKILDQIVLMNSSFVLPWALNIVWPFMSEETRNLIETFTESNNDTTMAYLDERIEINQRLPELGGTRILSPPGSGLLHKSSCNGTTSSSVTRTRIHGTPNFMAYLEYLVAFFVGMVIAVTCLCIVRAKCIKRKNARYSHCRTEENVKVVI